MTIIIKCSKLDIQNDTNLCAYASEAAVVIKIGITYKLAYLHEDMLRSIVGMGNRCSRN